jgi:carnosine N-methyltransferase
LFESIQLADGSIQMKKEPVRHGDTMKMRSTLKSFMREWSSMGERERLQSFQPVLDEVASYFEMTLGRKPYDRETGERVSVLLPGCGLGRLVFEFARRGYKAQGNEFAYFCLLSSNFILNIVEHKEQFELFPFIHCFSNLKKD